MVSVGKRLENCIRPNEVPLLMSEIIVNYVKGETHMSKVKKDTIEAKGFAIQIYTEDFKNDYISLTDIAKYKNTDDPRFVIQNWMRNRNTLEFIGLWEVLNNENFNRVQFDTFRNEAGLNRFTMTPQK